MWGHNHCRGGRLAVAAMCYTVAVAIKISLRSSLNEWDRLRVGLYLTTLGLLLQPGYDRNIKAVFPSSP